MIPTFEFDLMSTLAVLCDFYFATVSWVCYLVCHCSHPRDLPDILVYGVSPLLMPDAF